MIDLIDLEIPNPYLPRKNNPMVLARLIGSKDMEAAGRQRWFNHVDRQAQHTVQRITDIVTARGRLYNVSHGEDIEQLYRSRTLTL